MFFLYVDESGDTGAQGSPTESFILSGLVVHESKWRPVLDEILKFRKQVRDVYGFKLKEELHASAMMNKPGDLSRIPKSIRLKILRQALDCQASLENISIINVIVRKKGKASDADFFELAWKALIQRFQNTLSHNNFPGSEWTNEFGMIIADRTDEKKLRDLTRKMRHYNPVPSKIGTSARALPLTHIIEDPVLRDSLHSYFIQLCDVNAYFLKQKCDPSLYVKKKGARNYFDRLDKVLCKVASRRSKLGVVWL